MTHAHRRPIRILVVATSLASVAIGGCERLAPKGEASTMTLLRDGSEKVCTAADVQHTLHDIIIPVPSTLDAGAADRKAAIAGLVITYDNTTLEGFDKAVAKATCNASVSIAAPDGTSNKFDVDYRISPSADNPGTFIVSARSTQASAYAEQLIASAVQRGAADQAVKQQQADAQQARAKLLAVITPKWLAGTWIRIGADASNCGDQRALTIGSNRVYGSQGHEGRWALDGDQLHFVGAGPSGTSDDDLSTITQADAVSFTTTNHDGTMSRFRRCSGDEIAEGIADAMDNAAVGTVIEAPQ